MTPTGPHPEIRFSGPTTPGDAAGTASKVWPDPASAVGQVADGSTVLISGFGMAGMPIALIEALIDQGATDLTVVSNNAGNGDHGLAALLKAGRVAKMVCSFPRQSDSYVFDDLYRSRRIDLEVIPQGTLAERMRAAGAGIGAFFSPTSAGTPLGAGKEERMIDGRLHVLETPLRGDIALIGAHRADTIGNLTYRKTARNFGPVMATAATETVAQVSDIVPVGAIDPESVITPGIYVDRICLAFQRSTAQDRAPASARIGPRTTRPRSASPSPDQRTSP